MPFTLTQTRDQQYAASIYRQVTAFQANHNEAEQRRYGSLAHKLPILIRTAGLAQALAFVDARDNAASKQILDDLGKVVGAGGRAGLLAASRGSADQPLVEYMALTRETLTALLWYKRYAQSLLKVKDQHAADEAAEGEAG